MQFRKVQALRGPNIWANYPVLEAWLDLGALKDSPSDELPGFNERLMSWLPSMIEHRCSVGERGGFFERLRRGTYQGHILEHLALELQTLAGTDVGFGRTRESNEEGVYKVVVEYENEELGRASLEVALRLCLAAVHDLPFDVQAEIAQLRELARRVLPKPGLAAVLEAARKRKIPVRWLDEDGLLQLGYGVKQRRLRGGQTDRSGALAEGIAGDNELTQKLLQAAGIPVPEAQGAGSAAEAWEAAEDLGLPVVVKPRHGDGRQGVGRNLTTKEQVAAAYEAAAREGDSVLVERFAAGADYRLLVIGERVAAAIRRDADQWRDVTGRVHPEVVARAVEAARIVGLDVAGIDVIAGDIGRPLEEQGGVVAGVRAKPCLDEFVLAASASGPAVGEALLAHLFPEGHTGRIPVVGVTGVNGKTTTTRLITHIVSRAYRCVGMTCTEGIYICGRRVDTGDCSGPQSARAVLQHPRVEAAVLETARGGILREGLGFDRCDVAVVTNIAEGDHLGIADIDTPEKLARVKRVLVEAVAPGGAAVLNAADPLVVAMAEHTKGSVVFFARDGADPVLIAHRAANGRAAFARDNHIILAEGDQEIPLVALDDVPLTHGGRVGFQVENALAAAAAAWSLGVPCQAIRVGLETFGAGVDKVPGRFNLFEVNGATVVVDYGHNASSLASLIEVLGQFPHRRRRAVYSTAGDRRDCDLVRQGQLLGQAFDHVLLYEDHYLRGRKPGEIIGLFRQGLAAGSRVKEIEEVRGAVKAMEVALEGARPGDLLLVQADVIDETVEFFRRLLASGAVAGREIDLAEALAASHVHAATVACAPPHGAEGRGRRGGKGVFVS